MLHMAEIGFFLGEERVNKISLTAQAVTKQEEHKGERKFISKKTNPQ